MKKLLLIAAAVLAGASGLRAEEYTAISPDGKITVTVSTAPELRWSVTREGERLLIPLNMRDGALICTGLGNDDWNQSAPHGAGRLFSRTQAENSFTLCAF